MPNTRAPVLVVAGLAREARIASGEGVRTLQAGSRPAILREALSGLDDPLRAVVSFGIAGGLDPALAPGDVVVGASLVAESGGATTCDPAITDAFRRRLSGAGFRIVTAAVAGVDEAVLTPQAKTSLRARTGAAAVDMESHVAATYAARRSLPFALLRVVCDPASRALPAFAATALKPNGEPDVLAVLAALARGKARPGELIRLARDSRAAFASLGRARARLGLALGIDA